MAYIGCRMQQTVTSESLNLSGHLITKKLKAGLIYPLKTVVSHLKMEIQVITGNESNWLKCYRPLITLCGGENLRKKRLRRSYLLLCVLSSSVPRRKSLNLRLIYHKTQKRNTMKLSKSCKYNTMILSLPSFVECRKIPVLSPGLTQLRKRNGRAYIWEGGKGLDGPMTGGTYKRRGGGGLITGILR